jgi:hypothetical protein
MQSKAFAVDFIIKNKFIFQCCVISWLLFWTVNNNCDYSNGKTQSVKDTKYKNRASKLHIYSET